ncbi:hypothetical protein DFJ74DRAFT_688016 [Hyaloraphidium curvatum]|nr:hypothetical protein DFJ74DRAFT_688016 [Hyaloraphidium curvatum]
MLLTLFQLLAPVCGFTYLHSSISSSSSSSQQPLHGPPSPLLTSLLAGSPQQEAKSTSLQPHVNQCLQTRLVRWHATMNWWRGCKLLEVHASATTAHGVR